MVDVRDDRDVKPLWEYAFDLPDEVESVILAVFGGTLSWPDASESMLFDLSDAWQDLSESISDAMPGWNAAANTIIGSWQGPSADAFAQQMQQLIWSVDTAGAPGIAQMASGYQNHALSFGREVQFEKYTINIAIAIAIIAIIISIIAAIFTFGAAAGGVGAATAALRVAVQSAIQKLIQAAGSMAFKEALKKLATISIRQAVVQGAKQVVRTSVNQLRNITVRDVIGEVIEEAAEEIATNLAAQLLQMGQTTDGGQQIRPDLDWNSVAASGLGGGIGGLLGPVVNALPGMSQLASRGLAGRMMASALNNAITSPMASTLSNLAVNGKPPNMSWGEYFAEAFSPKNMVEAGLSAVGRYGSVSPFNPGVYAPNTFQAPQNYATNLTQQMFGAPPSTDTSNLPGTAAAPDIGSSNSTANAPDTSSSSSADTSGTSTQQSTSSSSANTSTAPPASTSGETQSGSPAGESSAPSGTSTTSGSSTPAGTTAAPSTDVSGSQASSETGTQQGAPAPAPAAGSPTSQPGGQTTSTQTSGTQSGGQSSSQSGSQSGTRGDSGSTSSSTGDTNTSPSTDTSSTTETTSDTSSTTETTESTSETGEIQTSEATTDESATESNATQSAEPGTSEDNSSTTETNADQNADQGTNTDPAEATASTDQNADQATVGPDVETNSGQTTSETTGPQSSDASQDSATDPNSSSETQTATSSDRNENQVAPEVATATNEATTTADEATTTTTATDEQTAASTTTATSVAPETTPESTNESTTTDGSPPGGPVAAPITSPPQSTPSPSTSPSAPSTSTTRTTPTTADSQTDTSQESTGNTDVGTTDDRGLAPQELFSLPADPETFTSSADVLANNLGVPVTEEVLQEIAQVMGIDLSEADITVPTDAVTIAYYDSHSAFAGTMPIEGRPNLLILPSSFITAENLAVTLAHEFVHVHQILDGTYDTLAGVMAGQDPRDSPLERPAYAIEDAARERFRASGYQYSGGSDADTDSDQSQSADSRQGDDDAGGAARHRGSDQDGRPLLRQFNGGVDNDSSAGSAHEGDTGRDPVQHAGDRVESGNDPAGNDPDQGDVNGAPSDQPSDTSADEQNQERETGGRIRRPESGSISEMEWEVAAYDAIREDTQDVGEIAASVRSYIDGIADGTIDNAPDIPADVLNDLGNPDEIAKIKHHLFISEDHNLTDYGPDGPIMVDGEVQTVKGRFDEDANIAEAWIRLSLGKPLPDDVLLLAHELTESRHLAEHPQDAYITAHRVANQTATWERKGEYPNTGENLREWRNRDGDQRVLPEDGRDRDPGDVRGGRRPDGTASSPGDRQSGGAAPSGDIRNTSSVDGVPDDHGTAREDGNLDRARPQAVVDPSVAEAAITAAHGHPTATATAETAGTIEITTDPNATPLRIQIITDPSLASDVVAATDAAPDGRVTIRLVEGLTTGQQSEAVTHAVQQAISAHEQTAVADSNPLTESSHGAVNRRPGEQGARDMEWGDAAYDAIRQDSQDVSDIAEAVAANADALLTPDDDDTHSFSPDIIAALSDPEVIARIKHHLFEAEQDLFASFDQDGNYPMQDGEYVTYRARFDSHASQAEAWIRLASGRAERFDVRLLHHELQEIQTLAENPGMPYRIAHDLVQQSVDWQSVQTAIVSRENLREWKSRHGERAGISQDRGNGLDSDVRSDRESDGAARDAHDRQSGAVAPERRVRNAEPGSGVHGDPVPPSQDRGVARPGDASGLDPDSASAADVAAAAEVDEASDRLASELENLDSIEETGTAEEIAAQSERVTLVNEEIDKLFDQLGVTATPYSASPVDARNQAFADAHRTSPFLEVRMLAAIHLQQSEAAQAMNPDFSIDQLLQHSQHTRSRDGINAADSLLNIHAGIDTLTTQQAQHVVQRVLAASHRSIAPLKGSLRQTSRQSSDPHAVLRTFLADHGAPTDAHSAPQKADEAPVARSIRQAMAGIYLQDRAERMNQLLAHLGLDLPGARWLYNSGEVGAPQIAAMRYQYQVYATPAGLVYQVDKGAERPADLDGMHTYFDESGRRHIEFGDTKGDYRGHAYENWNDRAEDLHDADREDPGLLWHLSNDGTTAPDKWNKQQRSQLAAIDALRTRAENDLAAARQAGDANATADAQLRVDELTEARLVWVTPYQAQADTFQVEALDRGVDVSIRVVPVADDAQSTPAQPMPAPDRPHTPPGHDASRHRDNVDLTRSTSPDHTRDLGPLKGNAADHRIMGPLNLRPLEDPQYQADVENALRQPDGTYLQGADPQTHPYGRLINDGGPQVDGRSNNCLDCSLSAIASFLGEPTVAVPRFGDLNSDGTPDTVKGEFNGLQRAFDWLGWGLASYEGVPEFVGQPISQQFWAAHNYINSLGPGSAALVDTEWQKYREKVPTADDGTPITDGSQEITYEPVMKADGTPEIDGAHATVIVYPKDGTGPVWWDPQSGATSDRPPQWMIDATAHLLFTPIAANPGASNANTDNDSGRDGVPGSDLSARPVQPVQVPGRLGLHEDSEPAGDRRGPGARPGEDGDRRGDRGGVPVRQPSTTTDNRDAYRVQPDGSEPGRPSDLSAPVDDQPAENERDGRHDRVSDDRGIADGSAEADRAALVDFAEEQPALRPDGLDVSPGERASEMGARPEPGNLAGDRDSQPLAAQHTASALPETTFRPDPNVDPKSVAKTLDRIGAERDRGTRRDPIKALERATRSTVELVGARDGSIDLRIRRAEDPAFTLTVDIGATTVDPVTGPAVASTQVDSATRTAQTTLSEHARPEHILRAIAHEVRETAMSLIAEQVNNDTDLLNRHVVPDPFIAQHSTDDWQSFSPHDHGRLAELRILLDAFRNADTPRPLQGRSNPVRIDRAQLRTEITDLMAALGLDFRADANDDIGFDTALSQTAAGVRLRAITSPNLKRMIRSFNRTELHVAPSAMPSIRHYLTKAMLTASLPAAVRTATAFIGANPMSAITQFSVGLTVGVIADRLKDRRSVEAKEVTLAENPRTAAEDISDHAAIRDSQRLSRDLLRNYGAALDNDPSTVNDPFGTNADSRRDALIDAHDRAAAEHRQDADKRADQPDAVPSRTPDDESERLGSRNAIRFKAAASPSVIGVVWAGYASLTGSWAAPIVAYVAGQFVAAVAGMRGELRVEEVRQTVLDQQNEERSRLQVQSRDVAAAAYDERLGNWLRTEATSAWEQQNELFARLRAIEADLNAGNPVTLDEITALIDASSVPQTPRFEGLNSSDTSTSSLLATPADDVTSDALESALNRVSTSEDRLHRTRFRPRRRRRIARELTEAAQEVEQIVDANDLRPSDDGRGNQDRIERRMLLRSDVRDKLAQFENSPTRDGRSAVAGFRTFLWGRGPAGILATAPASALFTADMTGDPIVAVASGLVTAGAGMWAARGEQRIEQTQEYRKYQRFLPKDTAGVDLSRIQDAGGAATLRLHSDLVNRQAALEQLLERLQQATGTQPTASATNPVASTPTTSSNSPTTRSTDPTREEAVARDVRRAYRLRYAANAAVRGLAEAATLAAEVVLGRPISDSNSASAAGRAALAGTASVTSGLGERGAKERIDDLKEQSEAEGKRNLMTPERAAQAEASKYLRHAELPSDPMERAEQALRDLRDEVDSQSTDLNLTGSRITTTRQAVDDNLSRLSSVRDALAHRDPQSATLTDLNAVIDQFNDARDSLAAMRTGTELIAVLEDAINAGRPEDALIELHRGLTALEALGDPSSADSVTAARDRVGALIATLAPIAHAARTELHDSARARLADVERELGQIADRSATAQRDLAAARHGLRSADARTALDEALKRLADTSRSIDASRTTLTNQAQAIDPPNLSNQNSPNPQVHDSAARRAIGAHRDIDSALRDAERAQNAIDSALRLTENARAHDLLGIMRDAQSTVDALLAGVLDPVTAAASPAADQLLQTQNAIQQQRLQLSKLVDDADLIRQDIESAPDATQAAQARAQLENRREQAEQLAEEIASARVELVQRIAAVAAERSMQRRDELTAQITDFVRDTDASADKAQQARDSARRSPATDRRGQALVRAVERASSQADRAAIRAADLQREATRLSAAIAQVAGDPDIQAESRTQLGELVAQLEQAHADLEHERDVASEAAAQATSEAQAAAAHAAMRSLQTEADHIAQDVTSTAELARAAAETIDNVALSNASALPGADAVSTFINSISADLTAHQGSLARLHNELSDAISAARDRADLSAVRDPAEVAEAVSRLARAGALVGDVRSEIATLEQLAAYADAAADLAAAFEQTGTAQQALASAEGRAQSAVTDAQALLGSPSADESVAQALADATKAQTFSRVARRRLNATVTALEEAATYVRDSAQRSVMAQLISQSLVDLDLITEAVESSSTHSDAARRGLDDSASTQPTPAADPTMTAQAHQRATEAQGRVDALVIDAEAQLAAFGAAEDALAVITALPQGLSPELDAMITDALAAARELQRLGDTVETEIQTARTTATRAETSANATTTSTDPDLELARVEHAISNIDDIETKVRAELGDIARQSAAIERAGAIASALAVQAEVGRAADTSTEAGRQARTSAEATGNRGTDALNSLRALDPNDAAAADLRATLADVEAAAQLLDSRTSAALDARSALDGSVARTETETHLADRQAAAAQAQQDGAELTAAVDALAETTDRLASLTNDANAQIATLAVADLNQHLQLAASQLADQLADAQIRAADATRAAETAQSETRSSATQTTATVEGATRAAAAASQALTEARDQQQLLQRHGRIVAHLATQPVGPEPRTLSQLTATTDALVQAVRSSLAESLAESGRAHNNASAAQALATRDALADLGQESVARTERISAAIDEALTVAMSMQGRSPADTAADQLIDAVADVEAELNRGTRRLNSLASRAASAATATSPDFRRLAVLLREGDAQSVALQDLEATIDGLVDRLHSVAMVDTALRLIEDALASKTDADSAIQSLTDARDSLPADPATVPYEQAISRALADAQQDATELAAAEPDLMALSDRASALLGQLGTTADIDTTAITDLTNDTRVRLRDVDATADRSARANQDGQHQADLGAATVALNEVRALAEPTADATTDAEGARDAAREIAEAARDLVGDSDRSVDQAAQQALDEALLADEAARRVREIAQRMDRRVNALNDLVQRAHGSPDQAANALRAVLDDGALVERATDRLSRAQDSLAEHHTAARLALQAARMHAHLSLGSGARSLADSSLDALSDAVQDAASEVPANLDPSIPAPGRDALAAYDDSVAALASADALFDAARELATEALSDVPQDPARAQEKLDGAQRLLDDAHDQLETADRQADRARELLRASDVDTNRNLPGIRPALGGHEISEHSGTGGTQSTTSTPSSPSTDDVTRARAEVAKQVADATRSTISAIADARSAVQALDPLTAGPQATAAEDARRQLSDAMQRLEEIASSIDDLNERAGRLSRADSQSAEDVSRELSSALDRLAQAQTETRAAITRARSLIGQRPTTSATSTVRRPHANSFEARTRQSTPQRSQQTNTRSETEQRHTRRVSRLSEAQQERASEAQRERANEAHRAQMLWRIIRSGITIGDLPDELRYLLIDPPPELEETPPTEPSEPEEPTEPTEPEEPTEPSEPEEPSEPTEPSEPEEPTGPTQPPGPPENVPPVDPNPDPSDCELPPAGADAVPAAIAAAERAAERLGATVEVVGPNTIQIHIPGLAPITIEFSTAAGDHTQALVVTRDGDTILVQVNPNASAADISVEIAAGVTMAILYAWGIDDAPSMLAPGTHPVPGQSVGLADRQKSAVLAELIYQYVYADENTRPAAAAALNAQVDAMGLDLDSGREDALARRALLPHFVYNDLEKFIPDWNSADSGATELDDRDDITECVAEEAESIRTVQEQFPRP